MRLRTAPHAGLLAIMLLGIARHASAHPVPFSYIDVRIDPDVIHVSVTVHVFDLGHDLAVSPPDRLMDSAVLSEKASAIDALIEQRLHVVVDGRELGVVKSGQIEALVERQSLRLLFDYRPERSPGLVTVRTVMFPYDVTHQTFLNVYDSGSLASQAILDADRSEFEYFAGTLYGAARAGLRFFWRGTLYIFAGPGCWLFLTGLILLGGSTRWIILVVTAFTVADATGLAMARAHMLSPPDRVLEPALALSLVYLGIDNLLASGGRDVRVAMAVWFGWINGFMVASTMRAVALSTSAFISSFLTFHAGLELGQVLVVVATASVLSAMRSRSKWGGRQLAAAGSFVLILVGALWFAARVFLPGGFSSGPLT